jgi:hypothetical protein
VLWILNSNGSFDPDPESGFESGSRKAKIICLNFAKWQVDLYSISAMFVQLTFLVAFPVCNLNLFVK